MNIKNILNHKSPYFENKREKIETPKESRPYRAKLKKKDTKQCINYAIEIRHKTFTKLDIKVKTIGRKMETPRFAKYNAI